MYSKVPTRQFNLNLGRGFRLEKITYELEFFVLKEIVANTFST